MRLKHLIAGIFFSSLMSHCLANGAPYLGGALGISDTMSSSSSSRGLTGSLFGGYGSIVNQNIYVGGELFADLVDIELSDNSDGSTNVRTTFGLGLSFIPGYYLSSSTMLYARLGLMRTNFTHYSWTTGTQFGFGLQTTAAQHWDIRAEYDYIAYKAFSDASPNADQFKFALVYKFD